MLDLAIKDFSLLPFSDQQQVALRHLLNGLANSEVQRVVWLHLWDLKFSEDSWSRTLDMLSLLEAEVRAGRLKAPKVATVGTANY